MRVSLAGCVITFGNVRCIKGTWGGREMGEVSERAHRSKEK